jgi:hypothetical protein
MPLVGLYQTLDRSSGQTDFRVIYWMSLGRPLAATLKTPATMREMIRDQPATRVASVQFRLGNKSSQSTITKNQEGAGNEEFPIGVRAGDDYLG